MMVLEMREMDAKDEFLLEFSSAIRAATKEEYARICEERAEEKKYGAFWDSKAGQTAEILANLIRASK